MNAALSIALTSAGIGLLLLLVARDKPTFLQDEIRSIGYFVLALAAALSFLWALYQPVGPRTWMYVGTMIVSLLAMVGCYRHSNALHRRWEEQPEIRSAKKISEELSLKVRTLLDRNR